MREGCITKTANLEIKRISRKKPVPQGDQSIAGTVAPLKAQEEVPLAPQADKRYVEHRLTQRSFNWLAACLAAVLGYLCAGIPGCLMAAVLAGALFGSTHTQTSYVSMA